MAQRGRRLDPVAERRRVLMIQFVVMAVLAVVALILVVQALQVP